jgi:TctA family transporter
LEGVPVLAIVMGTFAIPEIMDLAIKRTAIAQDVSKKTITNVGAGIRDTFQNWFLVIRSALMGVLIGFIPGLGAYVSSYVVYGQAARTVKNPKFGKGDVRGVIAPESANNATEGGALIPTIMFGVPGSPAFVVLLGAFIIFGLQPGPDMVREHLDLTFVMALTLVFSNLIGGFGLLAVAKKTALITVVRFSLLVPIITTFCFMGAYMSRTHIGDLVVMMVFGIIGYGLRHLNWSLLAFMLGYIFSSEGERNLYSTLNMFGFSGFFRSPISIVLIILILATFVFPVIRAAWHKFKKTDQKKSVEEDKGSPPFLFRFSPELFFSLLVLSLFIASLFMTLSLPARARTFPLGVSIGGVLTSFIILVSSFQRSIQIDGIAKKLEVEPKVFKQRSVNIIAWLGGYFICSWLLGVEYALPLISFLYLKFYNKEGWFISTIITLSLIGLLFGLFGHVLNVFWIEGKLFKILGLIF